MRRWRILAIVYFLGQESHHDLLSAALFCGRTVVHFRLPVALLQLCEFEGDFDTGICCLCERYHEGSSQWLSCENNGRFDGETVCALCPCNFSRSFLGQHVLLGTLREISDCTKKRSSLGRHSLFSKISAIMCSANVLDF